MARGKKKESALTPEEKLAQALVPEDEQPYKVPGNWCWTRTGSIAEVASGGTPSSSVAEYYEGGTIPWISPADLSGYNDIYISSGAKNITELGLEKSSARLLPADTVCLSSRAPIGYVAITQNPLCTNQGFKNFMPSMCYLPKYLYWYLKGNKELLESYASGTTFLELSGSKAAVVEIPLAPLAEQQRIVDRIESLFAKLDEAKEKAQSVLDSFETRKAAILHKAYTGELTAKWRVEHGVKLGSWQRTKFRDFCLLKRGFDLPASQRVKGDYPLVSSSGVIDCHNTAQVKGPGVVTGRSGTIGKVFYIKEDYWPLNTTLYSEKLFGNDARYVCYYLHTFDFKSFSSSTAVPTLNRNLFLDEMVLVPPVNEQKEIVCILDGLLAKEQQAKDAAEAGLEKIVLLKKSILARAFRGELGTNDPTEESALELLKKVL